MAGAAEIDKLFKQALSGDCDDDAPWQAVHALRRIGTREVFERAVDLCSSTDPLRRARGADVLAQLGRTADHLTNNFPDESYSVVTDLVRRETATQPIASGIYALGHLGNPLAIPLIASFSSHSTPEVRLAVSFALGCFADDPLSTQTLLRLTRDTDEDVRDWATFGLGVLGDADSEEIREALIQRLNDRDADVQEEALVGLGKRKDPRVLHHLMAALEEPETTVRVIEAASLMLGMEKEEESWMAADYAAALRKHFSL